MMRGRLWKAVTLGAAAAGMAVCGAGTAQATAPSVSAGSTQTANDGGANSVRTQTKGSTAIHTSPRTTAEIWTFGPNVSPVMVWLVAD